MNRLGLVVAVILLVLIVAGTPMHVVSKKLDNYDPAPPLFLLEHILNDIIQGDLRHAKILCHEALSLNVPSRIELDHKLLFESLNETIYILLMIEENNYTKTQIYDLYRLRTTVVKQAEVYVSILTSFIEDKPTSYLLRTKLLSIIDLFSKKLDYYLATALNVIGSQSISARLIVPGVVIAGERTLVTIRFTTSNLTGINATITLICGLYREDIDLYGLSSNKSYRINILVPGLEKTEVAPKTAIFIVVLRAMYNGTLLRGYVINETRVHYESPGLIFRIPSNVKPGDNLTMRIVSNAIYPLPASIYVDSVDAKHLLANISILPGPHDYTIPFYNVSRGIHTLHIRISPLGRYLGTGYMKAIIVMGKQPNLELLVPTLVMVPPGYFRMNINPDVSGTVKIYVSDMLVLEQHVDNRTSIEVPLPSILYMWGYNVGMEYLPDDPDYEIYTRTFTVYTINIPATILLSSLLSGLLLITTNEKYIIAVKRLLVTTQRIVGKIIRRRIEVTIPLYKRLIGIIGYEPYPWETLREYYSRISGRLGRIIKPLVEKFIILYEELIYSNHRIDHSILRRILDQILSTLKSSKT